MFHSATQNPGRQEKKRVLEREIVIYLFVIYLFIVIYLCYVMLLLFIYLFIVIYLSTLPLKIFSPFQLLPDIFLISKYFTNPHMIVNLNG